MSFASGYIPVIPLKNTVLFPEISMPLRVGRERSVSALQRAIRDQKWIVLLTQKNPAVNVEKTDDLFSVGTLCKIESYKLDDDGSYNVFVKAHKKIRVIQYRETENFYEVLSESVEDLLNIDKKTQDALLGSIKQLSYEVLQLLPGNLQRIREWIEEIQDLSMLTNVCAANADFTLNEKQSLLEISDLKERALKILDLLQELKERLKIQMGIRQKLNENFQQNQKENILREQMKVIREELGDSDENNLVEKFREKIEKSGMKDEALQLAKSQLKRLETINSSSPEYQMIRTHLELMVALPWNKTSEHREIDLDEAEKVLNEDHFGLDKIKKRILQHLAVMKLRKSHQGSIF